MDKAHALPPGSVDKELIKQAAEMLASLVHYYCSAHSFITQ
jgi:hypothetical protein